MLQEISLPLFREIVCLLEYLMLPEIFKFYKKAIHFSTRLSHYQLIRHERGDTFSACKSGTALKIEIKIPRNLVYKSKDQK